MSEREGADGRGPGTSVPATRHRGGRARTAALAVVLALVAAAIASTFLVTVLEVRGSTMEPALEGGSYALVLRGSGFSRGEVAAFEYDHKVLIKRVVAVGGDVVDVKEDGTVFLNGEELAESYATFTRVVASGGDDEGEGSLVYPYTVPEGSYFVLGDDRSDNSDSRNPEVAALSASAAIGRVVLSV